MTTCTIPGAYPSSLVSRLPPELLVNIFEFLIIHLSPAPLLRVCHRWADIASSVSSLRSRIDFSTPLAPLLKRNTDHPIDVILVSFPDVPTLVQRRAAAEVLSQYNHRVRKLVLDLSASHLREIELEFSATFPILVDVSISAAHNRRRTIRSGSHPSGYPPRPPPRGQSVI